MSDAETPFSIAVPDDQLELLKQKLELTRFPDELEDAGRDYGAPLADIQRLTEYWKDVHLPKWREHEAKLNEELPQFTRDIEVDGFGTLNIHYVHKKSTVVDAVPLLFVHGWPGSFVEVRKILPLLVEASPDHPSFHVVAIGLPNYGFSQGPSKKGFKCEQYAEKRSHQLLKGGDWGALITKRIAQLYGPKHSKAWHTNMPLAGPPQLTQSPLLFLSHYLFKYSPKERAGIDRTNWFEEKGSGYFKEQSTQPQTLGYSLADSPVGLLGWIYEKLVNWTDEYPWTEDEVLTWVSIYWFSRAGPAASIRIYYEILQGSLEGVSQNMATPIPLGHSYFPKEIAVHPRRWLKAANPTLIFESEHESGGHFAAYERPEALVGDLRKMFGRGGPAFGVVPGKTGF
ncbi:hypothetical protein H1R20_g3717, partial [Candolleomyces eurysporus]